MFEQCVLRGILDQEEVEDMQILIENDKIDQDLLKKMMESLIEKDPISLKPNINQIQKENEICEKIVEYLNKNVKGTACFMEIFDNKNCIVQNIDHQLQMQNDQDQQSTQNIRQLIKEFQQDIMFIQQKITELDFYENNSAINEEQQLAQSVLNQDNYQCIQEVVKKKINEKSKPQIFFEQMVEDENQLLNAIMMNHQNKFEKILLNSKIKQNEAIINYMKAKIMNDDNIFIYDIDKKVIDMKLEKDIESIDKQIQQQLDQLNENIQNNIDIDIKFYELHQDQNILQNDNQKEYAFIEQKLNYIQVLQLSLRKSNTSKIKNLVKNDIEILQQKICQIEYSIFNLQDYNQKLNQKMTELIDTHKN